MTRLLLSVVAGRLDADQQYGTSISQRTLRQRSLILSPDVGRGSISDRRRSNRSRSYSKVADGLFHPLVTSRFPASRFALVASTPRTTAHTDRDEALADAERLLIERGVLTPSETYAITCGEPMGLPGGTNMLKVCRVG